MNTSNWLITTFYKFIPMEVEDWSWFQKQLLDRAIGLRGLLLVGTEGCNGTLSGSEEAISDYKKFLQVHFGKLVFKDSWSDKHPFHEMKVKVKREIVSLNRPDLVPNSKRFHLSPGEWDQALKEAVVLDVRNKYETQIGRFKKALDPKLDEFNEFPEYLKNLNLSKDQKILMYCTGGIRCEKALLSANEQGYKNVYQLEGGILNYLKEFPNKEFHGECFIFDYRVAVDQKLQPSQKYRLCPHCGEPGDQSIGCLQCGKKDIVCIHCFNKAAELRTCSKNCAHHFKLGHATRRPHLDGHRKRVVR